MERRWEAWVEEDRQSECGIGKTVGTCHLGHCLVTTLIVLNRSLVVPGLVLVVCIRSPVTLHQERRTRAVAVRSRWRQVPTSVKPAGARAAQERQ